MKPFQTHCDPEKKSLKYFVVNAVKIYCKANSSR